ncbi:TolC family protein [bacterium]|nr:TolC family protein [bacterium]
MKKITLLIFFVILLFVSGTVNAENFKNEKYPSSKDVEPIVSDKNSQSAFTIKGGIESTYEVNLEDCVKYALGNNPRIQAAMQDVFASDSRLRQTWASYFPQLSWQSGYSRIKQLQLSDVFRENLIYNYWVLGQISVSQMLYDFGVTRNQATIRKLDNKGYGIILTSTINDVICDVKNNYYNLQYSLEAKRVAEESVLRYSAFYEQAKVYNSVGERSKVDVTIAQVNLSNAKWLLIQAEHNVKIAMAKLNNSMGLPYFNKYILNDGLKFNACDISLEKAIEIAQKSRPEFKLAEVKVEQARQNVKLVQKSYFPQFTIEGQYQVGGKHPTSNTGYNFGGYLNFPTINGMLIKNEIREARSLYSRQQALAKSTKNNIYLEVQQAFYTLDEKKKQIPVAKLGMKHAKENYELSCGRYAAGVGNPVELRDAQVQYSDAQLSYLRMIYEYNTAKSELEKAMGRNLTESEVELELPKKRFKRA